MQYMLMCCFDETAWNSLPDAQKEKIMRDYGEWVQNLVDTGHFRGGAKLHPAPSAKTVRMKNGSIDFTDGPFAETKEQLGGYHLIDCMESERGDVDRGPHPDASRRRHGRSALYRSVGVLNQYLPAGWRAGQALGCL